VEVFRKGFETPRGVVEGIQVKWPGFNVLWVVGPKGFLACGAFDVQACQKFGAAAAIVRSSPENPIGTLENFPNRDIKAANAAARALGIREGMPVKEAMALIA
jgi:uncharacterized protein YunC (DUF1805 family)